MRKMRVVCPRCGKTWWAFPGDTDVMCNCHTYCEDGTKPSDCTLVDHASGSVDAWEGNWNWPHGVDVGMDDGKTNKPLRRLKWCTVHEKYVHKVPFLIKVNWNKQKVSAKLRWHKGSV